MANAIQRSFSICIFVPDGDPNGLRLVEKSNWSGVGVVFNRTNYKQVVGREEFDKTGVYILVGYPDASSMPTIYVGEGDPVKDRLNQHFSKKDFWDWAVFFVTKDNSLNKAHVQRMECRLLQMAKAAKQCHLDNTNMPSPPTLSEAETARVESFLLDVLSICPLFGLSVFEKTEIITEPSHLLFIESSKRGIKATGYEDAKGFVVCKGSQAVKEESPKIPARIATIRKDLLEQGVLAEEGQHYVFTQHQPFRSPSMAAGVILGRWADGRTNWKTEDGTALKELQTAEVEKEET